GCLLGVDGSGGVYVASSRGPRANRRVSPRPAHSVGGLATGGAGAGRADPARSRRRRCCRWSGPGSGARADRKHWAGAAAARRSGSPMWIPRLVRRRRRAAADLVAVAPRLLSAVSNPVPAGRETPSDAVLSLSVFDPFFIGIDEFGHPVRLPMMF